MTDMRVQSEGYGDLIVSDMGEDCIVISQPDENDADIVVSWSQLNSIARQLAPRYGD